MNLYKLDRLEFNLLILDSQDKLEFKTMDFCT